MIAEMTLVDIGMQAMRFEELLFEAQGEITPEMEERMDALLSQGKENMDAAAWVVRKLTSDAEALKAEAKRLVERAGSFERNAESLKSRMLFTLDAAFNGKLKTERNTIWAQTSADTVGFEVAADADLAEIANENSMVVRRKYELDKPMLKNLLEAGEAIPHGIVVVQNPGKRSLRLK